MYYFLVKFVRESGKGVVLNEVFKGQDEAGVRRSALKWITGYNDNMLSDTDFDYYIIESVRFATSAEILEAAENEEA